MRDYEWNIENLNLAGWSYLDGKDYFIQLFEKMISGMEMEFGGKVKEGEMTKLNL